MDFALTEEQIAHWEEWNNFYQELMKSAPKNWRGSYGIEPGAIYGEEYADAIAPWIRHVVAAENERGYLNLHWPKTYGGQEIDPVEQLMLHEIKYYYRVPSGLWAGLDLLSPSLLEFGSEAQKREFLPRILSGEMWFCQAWSEPNSGSDLASLTTRAVRDGDHYIVNGQKTWVSNIKIANWAHSPFRTDPDVIKRHRGISYFIYPLDTPGITITTLHNSSNRAHWAEIYFDNARIPANYMIGAENQGWYVTMATAKSERSGAAFGEYKRHLEELVMYCVHTKRNSLRLIDNPYIREGIAELAVDIERLRAICYRSAWEQSKGQDVTKYASAAKILRTELMHKMSGFVTHRVGGLYGQIRLGSDWALFDGFFESFCEVDLGMVINEGTNDIQHNVIANWGLKLPRD